MKEVAINVAPGPDLEFYWIKKIILNVKENKRKISDELSWRKSISILQEGKKIELKFAVLHNNSVIIIIIIIILIIIIVIIIINNYIDNEKN